ncbi:unnamed protein product [Nippostrongylus brasiliensis]|uniref:Gamma-interferon-inducible lysosomal thiol reductase (inferred by orthology to a human protein) n=1 Tax=Nippostrongylus brasiliensis TaxID=27835 RepID=A0A158QY67_NIPBR|nr:unnamed protein product [Nippostrongylus brasiliensis]
MGIHLHQLVGSAIALERARFPAIRIGVLSAGRLAEGGGPLAHVCTSCCPSSANYPPNSRYVHPYHPNVAAYPVKAYQTYYPSSPSHHYTNQPTHHYCNIPPDLWCDSPQAAQQCGVQRQCDALRIHKRKPLKVTLIYEALCPYCQKFISNQLGSMYQQHKDHLELELVPWGNSRILRSSGALPFIVCFERIIHHNSVDQAMHACSAFIRSQYRQIRQCYDGDRGIQLQRSAAHKTMSTKPHPILEVPYLLINDYTPSVDNNNLNVMLLPQLLNKWFKLYT